MVKINALENDIEMYKQADIDIHAEINKATKDSEYLAEKTAEQEEENLRLKNLLAIKEDQLQAVYFSFERKKKEMLGKVRREMEAVRHSVSLGRANVRHELQFIQEQVMNFLREQINTMVGLAQTIRDRAREEMRMRVDAEWRDKYGRIKETYVKEIGELEMKLKVKNDEFMLETRALD